MWVKPKNLSLYSLFLLGVAASFPIQIMFLYGHSPVEVDAILAKLSVLNWLVILSATANAWLVFRASPKVIYTLPFGALCVILNNWVVGMWHIDYSTTMAELSTLGYLGSHGFLVRRSVMNLIFHPEKRGWLHASRHQVRVPTFVSPFNGTAFKTKSFDLSESGIFIPITPKDKFDHEQLELNRRVSLCLTLGLSQVRCDGKIVRVPKKELGGYPPGFGISFENISRQVRKELNYYLANADRFGTLTG